MHRLPSVVRRSHRAGLSMLELIAVMFVLGAIAAVIVPQLGGTGRAVDVETCDRHREAIDLHASLHLRNTGAWPAADLSDLATTLPEGLPVCPVDGSAYTFDSVTGRTVDHAH
ncbi:MAG: hypothetical protein AAF907_00810 [Planctomycetota bacterium]